MKPSIGRIVHFVVEFGIEGKICPAIITNVLSDTCVNLRVFYDGTNHAPEGSDEWKTSRYLDEKEIPDFGTWHWPPRV